MPRPLKIQGVTHWGYYENDLKNTISLGGKELPAEVLGKVRELTSDSEMMAWVAQQLAFTGCGLKSRLRAGKPDTTIDCMTCVEEETGARTP